VSLDNISQFLSAIDRAGELVRISEPVKARLEICEIADRVMKQPGGGKALYFENVILDNDIAIANHAEQVAMQAGYSHAMPPGNVTDMTDEERALIVAWFREGSQ